MDRHLNLETKRLVYRRSVVFSVLFYGAETWAPTPVLVEQVDSSLSKNQAPIN